MYTRNEIALAVLAMFVSVAVIAVAAIGARLAIPWTIVHGPLVAIYVFWALVLLAFSLTYRIGSRMRHKRDTGALVGRTA